MHNDELDEKRLQDFTNNTIIRVEMTVEQASDIYASLLTCADSFRRKGMTDTARRLTRLAYGFLGQRVDE